MKKFFLKKTMLVFLFFCFLGNLFAQNSNTDAKAYSQEEFPQVLKDLRRFEIITLGSLPFVMFDANIAYQSFRYANHGFSSEYSPNLFSPSSLSSKEQIGLVLSSLGISIGIGLTDYFIRQGKRKTLEKNKLINAQNTKIKFIVDMEDFNLAPPPENLLDLDVLNVQSQILEEDVVFLE